MSDFENYPYNEQHELNLDPTLKDLKEDKTTAENANKRVDGVEDTINNDNKKLDDANAKADAINQNADNFVDQSNTRINDIENNADNSVNDINKKADDISDKADDLNKKIADNADKVDDINNKQNETKEQVDDSVSNAYYENELTPEEMKSAKKMGVLKVTKANGTTSNEISTITPSGTLGNCVVWSSSPFTFINTNPQILTDQDLTGYKVIQYQCAGSFFLFNAAINTGYTALCSNGYVIDTGDGITTSSFDCYLITNKHLDLVLHDSFSSKQYTVILPKTDSKTFDGIAESFQHVGANTVMTTKQILSTSHVYAYIGKRTNPYSSGNTTIAGYIYNGTMKKTRIETDTSITMDTEYSGNTFTFKMTTMNSASAPDCYLYFVDLGEM